MSNVAGVNLPVNKPVLYALPYIFGIGLTRAGIICDSLNIERTKRVKDLSEEELAKIRAFIDKEYKVEHDLKHDIANNIKNMIAIRCYKGLRHQAHLPVRGQRTHDNAKTRKKGRA